MHSSIVTSVHVGAGPYPYRPQNLPRNSVLTESALGAAALELRRLARGLGIGRRLLSELEAATAHSGSEVVRLETNGSLTEAIALYRSSGYVEVEPFNDEPYAHHWFEKRLVDND